MEDKSSEFTVPVKLKTHITEDPELPTDHQQNES